MPLLPTVARSGIANASGVILVSTASLWEMAYKYGRGRWPEVKPIMDDLAGVIAQERMTALPVSVEHARAAGLLDWAHGDPFDRMLAAQAIAEDATLVTADRAFAAVPPVAGLRILWN